MLLGVIVFLNGAFGVGKTSTARILHEALPGSLIFDPESVGAMLWDAFPMTVWRADVWRHLRAGFREADSGLRAFGLTATEETLRARILGRPDEDGPHDWCLRHIPVAIAALRDEGLGIEIRTDGCTPAEVGASILHAL